MADAAVAADAKSRKIGSSIGSIGLAVVRLLLLTTAMAAVLLLCTDSKRALLLSSKVSMLMMMGRRGAAAAGGASSEVCRSSEDATQDGEWVWDESYPLYEPHSCPFADGGFRCVEAGRADWDYLRWRWQPRHCSLPRFDANAALERLRGGRVVFAGDSIARNQWESLLCLLASSKDMLRIKEEVYEVNGKSIDKHTGSFAFRFASHNLTVEYFRSPFLVPQCRPPPDAPPSVHSVLRLDTPDWTAPKWTGATLLVLSAGHWWTKDKTLRQGTGFMYGDEVREGMAIADAYAMAMRTVADWVAANMPGTHVIFRSYSPVHFRLGTWRNGGRCDVELLPENGNAAVTWNGWMEEAGRRIFRRPPLQLLDITHLTALRKDGHPSIWYPGPNMPPAPHHRQDCSHWCLPGVPDTWNVLLLHLLQQQHFNNNNNSDSLH